MTDRELLELAAKAAGMNLADYQGGGDDAQNGLWMARGYSNPNTGSRDWNPIKDDGDALRLAADLRLRIDPGKHMGDGCTVESQRPGIAGATAFHNTKSEQMRRAIVMVAAEIGKTMP